MIRTLSDTIYSIVQIKEKSMPILMQFGIRKAGLFGSYARHEANKESDIDFVLDIPDELDFAEVMGIQELLKQIFGKEVDIVEFDMLKGELKENVYSEVVYLYE
jgi:hypothetical protein